MSTDTWMALAHGDSLSALGCALPPTGFALHPPGLAVFAVAPRALLNAPPQPEAVVDGAASRRLYPLLSPNLADLSPLAESGIRFNGTVMTVDILAANALVFLNKYRDAGARGVWLVWGRQMQCFPLGAEFGRRERKEGKALMQKMLSSARR
ncbi:hypothetical protein GGR56DRAFT_668520 [Xylariaceae sp. FL0804]|nr:hypothetical protein GGR56DRAFT_668520 [Xylariaceae sp. FL0804]